MTGHNHYADCLCGWCVNLGGRTRQKGVLYASPDRARLFTSYESYTIPNASCPVCGASVFFYQSPTGGRVFFDELGPPWPKHPCTDNSSRPVRLLSSNHLSSNRAIEWVREGWEPILIRSSRLDSSWHAIPVQNLKSRLFYNALADSALHLVGDVFALMRPWDANGWSVISYVTLHPDVVVHEVPVFERKLHFRSSRSYAVARRAKP